MRVRVKGSGAILVVFTLASGLVAVFEACGGSSDVSIHVDGGPSLETTPRGSGVGSGGAGTTSSSSSGGSSGGGPGNDSGPDAPADAPPPPPDAGPDVGTTDPNACPPAPPASSAPCPGTRDCTYGTDPRFGCRLTATCTDGGQWTVTDRGCEAPPTCPADPPGTLVACTLDEICGYPSETCTCFSACRPPVCVNAAPIAANTFQCSKTPEGCPSSPPNLGTSCPTNGTACDYGGCNGGVSMKCADGVWKRNPMLCPG